MLKNKLVFQFFFLLSFLMGLAGSSLAANSIALVIKNEAGQFKAALSLSDLKKSFKIKSIVTETPWSNGEKRAYRGYSLMDLVNAEGWEHSSSIQGTAANGYALSISTAHIKTFNPILATEVGCTTKEAEAGLCRTGDYRPLSVSDFGPIFIVWPFDQLPGSVDPRDHSKWIWFLSEIRPIY